MKGHEKEQVRAADLLADYVCQHAVALVERFKMYPGGDGGSENRGPAPQVSGHAPDTRMQAWIDGHVDSM